MTRTELLQRLLVERNLPVPRSLTRVQEWVPLRPWTQMEQAAHRMILLEGLSEVSSVPEND